MYEQKTRAPCEEFITLGSYAVPNAGRFGAHANGKLDQVHGSACTNFGPSSFGAFWPVFNSSTGCLSLCLIRKPRGRRDASF